jgi:phage terminase small subunit
MSPGKPFTKLQGRFIDEYLVDLNGTKAAIRAGSRAVRADQAGHEFLSNPEIRREIDRRLAARAQKSGVSAERVLEEIGAMAFWDPADLVQVLVPLADGAAPEGMAVVSIGGVAYGARGIADAGDIGKLPEPIRRAIVGWGYDRNGNFTLKLADKAKALDQLARHLALYNDRLNVNVTGNLAERLARAKQRHGQD